MSDSLKPAFRPAHYFGEQAYETRGGTTAADLEPSKGLGFRLCSYCFYTDNAHITGCPNDTIYIVHRLVYISLIKIMY